MSIDLERRWATEGACRKEDAELFFTTGGWFNQPPIPSVQKKWDEAKQVCFRCPVLAQCRRDTLGEERGVWGGLDEHQRFRIRKALPKAAKNWPQSRRLALGRMIYDLRKVAEPKGRRIIRVDWSTIQQMTGITPELARTLMGEYDERRKAELAEKKAKVVDLHLPERPLLEFPNRPGKRDMWVRNNGVIADGAYRGESVNGSWLLVEVPNGRLRSQKWVRISDVKFYRRVPRYVVSDRERAA